jgi:hypothetical protein
MADKKSDKKLMTSEDAKKYAKLLGKIDYDHEAVEQLADMCNEIEGMRRRSAQLDQIVKENEELHQFLWRQADGMTVAIHNLDDDHLTNVMLHLLRSGRAIPRAIRGEAVQRGLTVPATVPVDWSQQHREAMRMLERGDMI